MTLYRRILLAVDLTEDSPGLAERACALGAEVEMLHVAEPVPLMVADSPEVMTPLVLQSQDELVSAVRRQLVELAGRVSIPERNVIVRVGNTKSEIVQLARERGTDLIVLGSRERHGLSVLLDFTEDGVLHRAPCDVLAIRVKPG